jgi:nitrate/nitrite-specific signal transduction histidine kinase
MQLKVGTKFASLSALAFLLISITTVLGIVELRSLSNYATTLASSVEASGYAHDLRFDLHRNGNAFAAGVAQRNPEAFGKLAQQRLETIERNIQSLSRVLNDRGDTERANRLLELHDTLRQETYAEIALANSGQWELAASRLANTITPATISLEEQVEQIGQELDQDAERVRSFVRQGRATYPSKVLLVIASSVLLLGLATWLLWRSIVTPIRRLTESATLLAGGNLAARASVGTQRDEIGAMATAFNSMADQLQTSHDSLAHKVQQRTAELESERAALQQALLDLQDSTAEREQLLATLAQLQNPVIPVIDGVIVAPIVGQLNHRRLELLQRTVLDAVTATHARVALLDITGVPEIDGESAGLLLQVGQGLRLLGATAILVGIRPEVAERLVAHGTRLAAIESAIDLQRGIDRALRLLRRRIVAAADQEAITAA